MIELPTDANPCVVVEGDCLSVLRAMPDGCVHCCVTSPPYYGLRDYGHPGQLGLEAAPAEYVAKLVAVFSEVRRVLRDDGTLWLNLGDSYASGTKGSGGTGKSGLRRDGREESRRLRSADESNGRAKFKAQKFAHDVKDKDLLGIPWRVAFALQADGWYLRQDIVWAKPNPMPESVTDRCTKAHEYVFLLSKSPRYYFDAEAIAEKSVSEKPAGNKVSATRGRLGGGSGWDAKPNPAASVPEFRNRRSVWAVTPEPFAGAHFAVMPPKLVGPCVLAGCPEGGTVLDPFLGSGTVAAVAAGLWRKAVGVELNPEYAAMARARVAKALGRNKDSLLSVLGETPDLFGDAP